MNDMTWKAVAAEIRTRLVPSWQVAHTAERKTQTQNSDSMLLVFDEHKQQ